MERCDIRVVELREKPRFPLESLHAFFVSSELLGKNFDGNVTPELGVASSVHLALPPAPMAERTSYAPRRAPGSWGMEVRMGRTVRILVGVSEAFKRPLHARLASPRMVKF